ncbi:MAG: bifunctional DNA-binding transcriptional regulator/O6-methylguanine-DNA methyltransferase Ada [Gammaproteobacteria bacterium]
MNELRWRAVAQKRPADFFYAVKSTGVYCRCGCASRTPRRENVEFFPRAEDAARAGYRACKKCRPDSPPPSSPPRDMVDACRRLEDAESVPALPLLAKEAGMSARHFHRRFTRHLGLTPKQYAEAARGGRWRGNLRTAESVTAAVYDSGFDSGARVYENPAAQLGMTPAAYNNGGGGEIVRAALDECPLGKILVAATSRGVCAVEFGDSDSALRRRLKQQFPRAKIDADDPRLRALVRKTILLIEEPRAAHDLPLDIRCTAFQRRVWRALQQIPPGETRSYSQIARDIGAPKAARAVGAACGQNKIAVAVPCHRAVGKNGEMRGYRWGVPRKQKLLERERTALSKKTTK